MDTLKTEAVIGVEQGHLCPFCKTRRVSRIEVFHDGSGSYLDEKLVCCEDRDCRKALRGDRPAHQVGNLVPISYRGLRSYGSQLINEAQRAFPTYFETKFEKMSREGLDHWVQGVVLSQPPEKV